MLRKFIEELEAIESELFKEAEVVIETLDYVKNYLKTRDEVLAERIKENEKKLDLQNFDVENKCLKLLALYHPVAKDLRLISMAMRISSNFERICDLCVEISERYKKKVEESLLEGVLRGIEIAKEMVNLSVDILKKKDTKIAGKLEERDNQIDELYLTMFSKIIGKIKEEPAKTEELVNLVIILRHIERIGDILCKNGARAVYVVEGKRIWIK